MLLRGVMYSAFDKSGLGSWVKKPMEQDLFSSYAVVESADKAEMKRDVEEMVHYFRMQTEGKE